MSIKWEKLGFIKASEYRLKVMNKLKKGSETPSNIAQSVDLRQNHVSATLTELADKELVKVMNPDAQKGRLYSLTDEGKELAEELGK
jgi:predicted transcriptional regulator